ncbi:MAG: ribose 5-phosphate isomerase B [Brevinema sp.]
MSKVRISMGSDHAAYPLKEAIKVWLLANNYEVVDCGTTSPEQSVDYTDYIYPASVMVRDKEVDFGIVMCGTGLGACYTANKVHGIRAALCHEEFSTRLSRQHNNANVLVLAGRIIAPQYAIELVKLWLDTPFDGGRHDIRINKIHEIEAKESQIKQC